jgi:hypothetical protein
LPVLIWTMNNTVVSHHGMLNTCLLQHSCYFQSQNKYRSTLQRIYIHCIEIKILDLDKIFQNKNGKTNLCDGQIIMKSEFYVVEISSSETRVGTSPFANVCICPCSVTADYTQECYV